MIYINIFKLFIYILENYLLFILIYNYQIISKIFKLIIFIYIYISIYEIIYIIVTFLNYTNYEILKLYKYNILVIKIMVFFIRHHYHLLHLTSYS